MGEEFHPSETSTDVSESRRSLLKKTGTIGGLAVGGSIPTVTTNVAAQTDSYDGKEEYDDEGITKKKDSNGNVLAEFHSNMVGYSNVGSDQEVQMGAYLAWDSNSDYGSCAYGFLNPRIKFETLSESSNGDVYLTDYRVYTQEDDNYPSELIEFAADAIWSLASLPGPNIFTLISANDPDTYLSSDRETYKVEWNDDALGVETFSTDWITNFGGNDASGWYKFRLTATMDFGEWVYDSMNRCIFDKRDTVSHEHEFWIECP